ncbi:MAG: hypothetical protein K0S34_2044 [Bacillales bacterium]|jgi:hypothetical protein|nr:hypothetical protein [Bacillales bacterium]
MDMPRLIKNKAFKELFIYVAILAIGDLLFIGLVLDWNIPSPLLLISKIYDPISNAIFNYLS